MAGTNRGHELVGHTADAGLRAWAESPAELFEEAGVALSALMAEVDRGARAEQWESVRLAADDMTGLAYGWLNELIGLAAVQRAAVVEVQVDDVAPGEGAASYRLAGRVGLREHDDSSVRALHDVKSATYHRLVVEEEAEMWRMEAYVDI